MLTERVVQGENLSDAKKNRKKVNEELRAAGFVSTVEYFKKNKVKRDCTRRHIIEAAKKSDALSVSYVVSAVPGAKPFNGTYWFKKNELDALYAEFKQRYEPVSA